MSRRTPTPGFAEYLMRQLEELREAERTGAEYPPCDNRTPDELLAEIDSLLAQLKPLPGASPDCHCENQQ